MIFIVHEMRIMFDALDGERSFRVRPGEAILCLDEYLWWFDGKVTFSRYGRDEMLGYQWIELAR